MSHSQLSPTITADSALAPISRSVRAKMSGSGLPIPTSPETTTAPNDAASPVPSSLSRWMSAGPW